LLEVGEGCGSLRASLGSGGSVPGAGNGELLNRARRRRIRVLLNPRTRATGGSQPSTATFTRFWWTWATERKRFHSKSWNVGPPRRRVLLTARRIRRRRNPSCPRRRRTVPPDVADSGPSDQIWTVRIASK
jgi:hypothetical protein